jgi:hypothetical protein
MNWTSKEILKVLDDCTESFNFPMLDNGYIYLAATKMTLFWSNNDWALVIEIFGYSPRSEIPDIQLYTFSSKLHNRNSEHNYVTQEAYQNYLVNNPYNEARFVYPIENEDWLDEKDQEKVKTGSFVTVRGKTVAPISNELYKDYSIVLENKTPMVFELARLLAAMKRESILANNNERRENVYPNLNQILVLDEWYHPDLVEGELPSGNETFQQLAEVLETGDISKYKPTKEPNTAWGNWPNGGLL